MSTTASASDRSQLIAGVGLTPAEAQSLSLSELAAMHFNRGSDRDNQQTVLHPGPVVAQTSAATMMSRSPTFVDTQLIAGAGLTESQAQGMTLNQVALKKFSRDNTL